MVRTLFTAVLASCIFGVLLGLGAAYSFLAVNGWDPAFEMKTYEDRRAAVRDQIANPNARAHIEDTVYHFGIMHVRDTGHRDFFIRNVGTADLTLAEDRTSCYCLGIEVTPTRVAPGGTARARLKYTAEQALPGRFVQGGVILTNDPENREIHLSVEGVFTNPVSVQPSGVNLPRVPAGATRTATVRLYGFEDEPLQLVEATWENREHFDFQWEPAEFTEEDREDFFLEFANSVVEGTITVKPGLPVGPFQEWFQLRTNYSTQMNVGFLVSGQVVGGNVSISGQGFNNATGVADLGRTVMGRSLSREISIQFRGATAQSASVQVSEVEPAWLRAELSPPRDVGPLRMFSLTITVPEDAPTGSYVFTGDGRRAHILLETGDETIRIPLQFVVAR